MPLQSSGAISVTDICGVNGLNISTANRTLQGLANLAVTTSIPYINRAQPKMSDWYGYSGKSISPYFSSSVMYRQQSWGSNNFTNVRNGAISVQGGSSASSPISFHIECRYSTTSAQYGFYRTMWGMDISTVSGAVSATFDINVTENGSGASQQYVLVKTNTARAYSYLWTTANWAEPVASGAALMSSAITVASGATGKFTFTLNAAGISYINANSSANFAMVQYTNDWLNTATGITSRADTGVRNLYGTLGNLTWT